MSEKVMKYFNEHKDEWLKKHLEEERKLLDEIEKKEAEELTVLENLEKSFPEYLKKHLEEEDKLIEEIKKKKALEQEEKNKEK